MAKTVSEAFSLSSVHPPQIFQVQAKISTIRPVSVFPDYLSVLMTMVITTKVVTSNCKYSKGKKSKKMPTNAVTYRALVLLRLLRMFFQLLSMFLYTIQVILQLKLSITITFVHLITWLVFETYKHRLHRWKITFWVAERNWGVMRKIKGFTWYTFTFKDLKCNLPTNKTPICLCINFFGTNHAGKILII